MNDIERLSVEVALRDMVRKGYFSICTIDSILKLTQLVRDERAYKTLSLLHCVQYGDMPPQILQELPELIRSALGNIEIDIVSAMTRRSELRIVDIDSEPTTAKKPGGLLAFFGKR